MAVALGVDEVPGGAGLAWEVGVGSGTGDTAAFGYLVFGLAGVADEVGVEGEALVRKVVAVTVDLELSLRARVLQDTVTRDHIQNLSKSTALEST